MNKKQQQLVVGAGLLALIAYGAAYPAPPNGEPQQQAIATCKSDWTKCADNADMANNFKGWFHVKYTCQTKAAELAKYGTPEWPWLPFGTFYSGDDYAKTGLVTVVEPDAKFQNGFGAMAHSKVICEYDLRADKIVNITIR